MDVLLLFFFLLGDRCAPSLPFWCWRPVELDYEDSFPSRSEALKEELRIKRLTRSQKKALISEAQRPPGCTSIGDKHTNTGSSKIPNLARRTLAAIYVRLDRLAEAQAVIKTFLANSPDYTLENVRLNFKGKYKNPTDLEQFVEDLRKAGLPE